MVLLPKCKCCGGQCFTQADRMVVTLSGLPHENYGYNLNVTDGWGRGLNYLDGYDGEYVLYKAKDTPNAGVPNSLRSGECKFIYWDGRGDSLATGEPTFSIEIVYKHGYDSFGNFEWERTVHVSVLGGTIDWSDTGGGSGPSAAKTYVEADLTDNSSPESYLFGGYLWLPLPWTLTSTTCEIAEYDAVTHASALTPCECFDLEDPATGSAYPFYKTTCLTYNGTSDPGTTDYSSVYSAHSNCNPGNALYCAPIVSANSITVGPYTFDWNDYGTDEIDLTITDMVLPSVNTFAVAGTYTLPYAGMSSSPPSFACQGSSSGRVISLTPGWTAGFTFTHSGTTHGLLLNVSLARSEIDLTYAPASTIYPPSRRVYVSASILSPTGIVRGASQCYQSDGSQSEDTYGCGNMPTVTGGYGVSGTMHQLGCSGTAYQWSWQVDQA